MIFNLVCKGNTPDSGEKQISQNGTYSPQSDGLDYFSSVVVNVQPALCAKNITQNGSYSASADNKDGYNTVTVNVSPSLQEKSVAPSNTSQQVTPDEGYDGLSSVTVSATSAAQALCAPDFEIKDDYLVCGKTNGTWADTHKLYVDGSFVSTVSEVQDLSLLSVGTGTKQFALKDENSQSFFAPSELSQAQTKQIKAYSKNLSYSYQNEYASLTGKGECTATQPVIPQFSYYQNNFYPVLTVQDGCFKNDTSITTVDASKVVKLDEEAFSGCSNLSAVTLSNLKEIYGNDVFKSTAISTLNLSSLRQYNGQGLCDNCTSLSQVITPSSGNISFGYKDFGGCTSLEQMEIKNGIKKIGANAFLNSGLKYAYFLGSPPIVDDNSFDGTPIGSNNGLVLVPQENLSEYVSNSMYASYIDRIALYKQTYAGEVLPGKITIGQTLYDVTYYQNRAHALGNTNELSQTGVNYTAANSNVCYGRIIEHVEPDGFTVTLTFERETIDTITYVDSSGEDVTVDIEYYQTSIEIPEITDLYVSTLLTGEYSMADYVPYYTDENGNELVFEQGGARAPINLTGNMTVNIGMV